MEFTVRTAGLVALLALVPVLTFGVFGIGFSGTGLYTIGVTAVNVGIITYALWRIATPVEGDHGVAEGH